MSVTREQVYQALFALVPSVTWSPGPTFAFTSRRVKIYGKIPDQPALCQAEYEEEISQAARMPPKRLFRASWLIYHNDGSHDPEGTPAILSNTILDAVEAAFLPLPTDPGFPDQRLTLGGLVHRCWIEGKIWKENGDLNGQALIDVPISILVP